MGKSGWRLRAKLCEQTLWKGRNLLGFASLTLWDALPNRRRRFWMISCYRSASCSETDRQRMSLQKDEKVRWWWKRRMAETEMLGTPWDNRRNGHWLPLSWKGLFQAGPWLLFGQQWCQRQNSRGIGTVERSAMATLDIRWWQWFWQWLIDN